MTSSTFALYDPQYAYVPNPLYPESLDTGSEDGSGDTFKLPGTLCFYPPYSNPNEQNSDVFPGSAYIERGSDYTLEFYLAEYQEQALSRNDQEHWPDGSDCFFPWSRGFFAVGDDIPHDNAHMLGSDSGQSDAGLLLRVNQVKCSHQNEEDTEGQIQCAYEASSGYWSWLEKQLEEYSKGYDSWDWEEPRASADKFDFCENIFGYWPCMSRE